MNNKYQESIHKNKLRTLRHQLELRQVDMADIMGFEVIDRICHWERGRAVPGLVNAIKLCKVFNLTLDELYPELCEQIQSEIQESRNSNFLKSLDMLRDPGDTLHIS